MQQVRIVVMIPDESSATPYGPYNVDDVAGPLSPLLLTDPPPPAIVAIIPVDTVTFRIRLLA